MKSEKIYKFLFAILFVLYFFDFGSNSQARFQPKCNEEIILKKLSFSGHVYKKKRLSTSGTNMFLYIQLDSFHFDGWTTSRDEPYFPDFYVICDSYGISIKDSTLLVADGDHVEIGDSVYSKLGEAEIYYFSADGKRKPWY